MTTKHVEMIVRPWERWPNGVIPAEGDRPPVKLRTPEEGRTWLNELAELRRKYRLPEGMTSLDLIRQERDER